MQAANCGQSGAKQTQPSVMSDSTNKYLKFDEPFFYRDGILNWWQDMTNAWTCSGEK
jgi:hypothetical protein